jgi:CNT family concentrative nucleoside transporter
MATVAGTVLALYASLLEGALPGAAGHLIAASVMSAPAALMIARLMVPEGFEEGPEKADVEIADAPHSSMDAIAQGTVDGLRILSHVIAMLIVMVALVALAHMILQAIAGSFAMDLTIQRMLGWLFAPLAWAIGIPWSEAGTAGALLGTKMILNELLAYIEMAGVPAEELSARSRLILLYALCGFANLGSLGIMIAGLVAMAPERREEIVSLGPRTIVSGTLATLLTGAIVGAMTPG